MCKIYKNSWSVLFNNLAIFLPTLLYGIIAYLLLFALIIPLALNQISPIVIISLIISVVVSILLFVLSSSIKLNYIKQAIRNKKINIKKDASIGIKYFKSLFLLRILLTLIFLIPSIVVAVVIVIILALANMLSLPPTIVITFFVLIGILVVISYIFISLSIVNTEASLILKNFRGRLAIRYSYRLFKQNKMEVFKTVLAIAITALILTIPLRILEVFNILPLLQIILQFIPSLIVVSWADTYIMLKFKTLRS